MKVLLRGILALLALAMLLPPQVKQVVSTYRTTEVVFWYPAITRLDGRWRMSQRVRIDVPGGTLRNLYGERAFLCADHACGDFENPVAKEWKVLDEKHAALVAEVASLRRTVSERQASLREAETFLAENDCESTVSGPEKPTFACGPGQEKDVATTICLIREAGPKLCEAVVEDETRETEIPGFLRDLLARESCEAVVASAMGETYDPLAATARKYTEDLPATLISGFIGLFSEDLQTGFDWAYVAFKVEQCVPGAMRRCAETHAGWESAVEAHRMLYSGRISECMEQAQRAEALRSEIAGLEDRIVYGEKEAAATLERRLVVERKVDIARHEHFVTAVLGP
jgi:hypothetical protein